MSRKCPGCNKWMASGQYTCRYCGAGEKQVDSALTLALGQFEATLLDIINLPERNLLFVTYDRPLRVRLEARLMALLEAGGAQLGRAAALHDHGELVVRCVGADLVRPLGRLLPHLSGARLDACFSTRLAGGNWTALGAALRLSRPRCLRMLLAAGASPEARGRDGVPAHLLLQHEAEQQQQQQQLIAYGWYAADAAQKEQLEERRRSVQQQLDVARGVLGRQEGAAEWSARAILNQGGVATPAPFPRAVWVRIVDCGELHSKAVTLPRVCRFFRNLIPVKERQLMVWNNFLGKNQKMPAELDPVFAYRVLQQMSLHFPQISAHAIALISNADRIARIPALPSWIFSTDLVHRRDQVSNKSIQEWTKTHLVTGRFIHVHIVHTSGRASVAQLPLYKLVVSDPNGIGRVKFAVQSARFGESEGGSEGAHRLHKGVTRACQILNVDLMSNEHFVEFLSLLFSGVCFCSRFSRDFFGQFLLNTTAELKVRESDALEVSQEIMEDDSVGVSIIALMRWSPKKLADWMQQNGIDAAIVQHVRDEELRGRLFINSTSLHEFIPDTITSIAERAEMAEMLVALKSKFFS